MTYAHGERRCEELPDIRVLAESFVRSLEAENKAPNTVRIYRGCIERLAEFLDAKGMPTDVTAITREHVDPLRFAALVDL